jgi:GNAT superfamily N-acetyltransferase
MTSPTQLRAGRTPPAPLRLQEVGKFEAPSVRSTYQRIGAPLGLIGRMDWSIAQWEREIDRPTVRAWIALVDDHVGGVVELQIEPDGSVGIVVFGLVPELIGRGFGGTLLTMATELAWTLTVPDGTPARRVWVQSSSRDHPHARPNYESRGFRVFSEETRP